MFRGVLCLVLVSASLRAQPGCQTELNGFLLGQSKIALASLGKPSKTGAENGWRFQAYELTAGSYFVFEFAPEAPERIAAIQISGEAADMQPFVGIKLADSQQQLLAIFGEPSAREDEHDLDLVLLQYSNRNYSFEMDKKQRVSSIRIVNQGCTDKLGPPLAPDGKNLVEELKTALEKRDVDSLMQILAPDVEIYKSGNAYTFTLPARLELEKHDTEFTRLLLGPQSSVLALLKDENAGPDAQMRMYTKHQPAHVIKFLGSKIVAEIVYDFQGGRWKVFEIRFR